MSTRRRAHQPRSLIIAAAVYVVLAIAARSAVLLGLGLLVAIGAAAVWIDRRHARRRAAPGPRGPRPGTRPPTVHAEVIRPDAQAAEHARQVEALKAEHARQLADAEARHRAQVADLEGQLAAARESAHAAWDAAADRPPAPRPRPEADARSALLGAPLSGARPLTGGRG